MSSLRKKLPTNIRSIMSENGMELVHFVPEEHLYADPSKQNQLKFLNQGKPAYSIQHQMKMGDKDPRSYLGQGFQETRQDPASMQIALNNFLSDPNNPAFRTIEQYATSLLNNGFKDAFDPVKRKRAKRNETNGGQGPPGAYVPQSEDVTPGLPTMQLPFYTGEQQAYQQMKKQQFADRAMENGGPAQVNNFDAAPGWYTMDRRLGIPTASGGFNYPTYMSNPNARNMVT